MRSEKGAGLKSQKGLPDPLYEPRADLTMPTIKHQVPYRQAAESSHLA